MMEAMTLNKWWKLQFYICLAACVAAMLVGGLLDSAPVFVVAVVVLIVSAIMAAIKLRCPACGSSVEREAMRWDLDGDFFCPKCGQRVMLE